MGEILHICNFKRCPIQESNCHSDLSSFIVDSSGRCQGYANESIALVLDWAFRRLNLRKIIEGIYAGNLGGRRAFEKCGFVLEDTLRQGVVIAGQRLDAWCLGLPRGSWSPC